MPANYYAEDEWNVICDLCHKKRKRSYCDFTWDGFLACKTTCWYPKHPFEDPLVIIPNEGGPVPDARPRPPLRYVEAQGISTWGNQISPNATNGQATWGDPDLTWGDDTSGGTPPLR